MQRSRALRRSVVPAALALGLVLGAAGAAAAHVEVDSSTAQALAVDAQVAFSAEGESSTAGIADVKVVLPGGLAPADVTLVKAPDGWALTPTADGYAVAGPSLAPGAAAEWTVKVRQLPDTDSLVFKTLVDYSDGHTDRWIELPQNGSKPEHPAPTLALRPAAPGATPLAGVGASAPASAAASASASASASAPASASASAPSSPSAAPSVAAAAPEDGADGTSTTAVVLGSIAGVAVLGALVVLVLRRRKSPSA
ncbi:hypothetical protein Kpho02_56420 [Kitasatospora phosalacinea]|uniref:YncI copper-binding domain-containing protein n=1 Tax=Kitasatospora phosalacinea TaxID=2065 RepID=A0A9W6QED6_9ACTN|nr:DUF1775 domain-containing protein [Kitasatospora phosalacinea]GLW73343.1 hypothetical protein Kpho02_56420 [Kitasatospora phosalacinea]